jgi:hypothetical protein
MWCNDSHAAAALDPLYSLWYLPLSSAWTHHDVIDSASRLVPCFLFLAQNEGGALAVCCGWVPTACLRQLAAAIGSVAVSTRLMGGRTS